MAVLAPPASAAPGDILLASISETGVKSNGTSTRPSVSADGRRVAFESTATNLDPADTDAISDIYVKDLVSGEILLASVSDTGVKGNGASTFAALSADGRTVAFRSAATNLDPADTDASTDIYVRDLASGDTILASTSDIGAKGNAASTCPAVSADATAVTFLSAATNLDPAATSGGLGLYVKDLTSGDIVLANVSATGQGVGVHCDPDPAFLGRGGIPSLSAGGGIVAYDGAFDGRDSDVYVKNLTTGENVEASAGLSGFDLSEEPSLSADGSTVAFHSQQSLDPFAFFIHVKDLASGALVAEFGGFKPSLSGTGGRVAFDAGLQIRVRDLLTGDEEVASSSAAGSQGNANSLDPAMSADGGSVAFGSVATNLDPTDTDALQDIYVKTLDLSAGVAIENAVVTEGDSGLRYVGALVTLSGPRQSPVSVEFATRDGTATARPPFAARSDYTARSGTLTFAAGTTRMFVIVPIVGDTRVEQRETFAVRLSDPLGATIADDQGVVAILNDDP